MVIVKPTSRLASLRPRLGLESDVVSHGVWSIGPSAEFFLNDNLSFSTGVQIAQQRAENHQKLRGFNSATGRNFEQTYRPPLPERYDQIDEIRIQTSALRLPVSGTSELLRTPSMPLVTGFFGRYVVRYVGLSGRSV